MAENFDGIVTAETALPAFPNRSAQLHEWLMEAAKEGEAIVNADPGLARLDEMIDYIQGQQLLEKNPPRWLPQIVVNLTKKAIRTHVSTLTDVKPLFAWKTPNPRYKEHADVLNSYTILWWINTFADLELASCVQYALAGGVGDMVIEFDKHFNGGDTRMMARDPRDTLPIRPERSRDIQDWLGVTIREPHSLNTLLHYFPDARYAIKPDSGAFPRARSRYRQREASVGRPASTLDGLSGGNPLTRSQKVDKLSTSPPICTLHRTYLHDYQRNLTTKPVLMGRPGANWSYLVPPGEPLYPRGRLFLWTEHGSLYDGPNPDWHGRFPIGRLKLDPWPWLFGAMPLLNDMRGPQDVINILVNDILAALKQSINRGQIWDRTVPASVRKTFDSREPGWKFQRPNAFSKGMELAEAPRLEAWAFQFLNLIFQKWDEFSGTQNLQALLQLRQVPGADTLDKYLQAMTPEIRLEARNLEVFLRDLALPLKSNLFQYQSARRRYTLLGDAGKVVDDLDYDPETMIPAMSPKEDDYTPELDVNLPRDQRAKFFTNAFVFYVEPSSMLAIAAQERKMTYLQLSRQGYVDLWTLAEILGIPNVGDPPYMLLQASGWQPDPAVPDAPPPLEYRMPRTIIERLQAQQQLGIGQTVSPAGRKAAGEVPPRMKQRPDGSTTITESRQS